MACIDLRALPPADRHTLVLATFEGLCAGQSFEFINDHEPRGLQRRFGELFGHAFDWETLERLPEIWRVRVTRLATGFASTLAGALAEPGDSSCACR
ncbi:MAG: DUF2249 domain-containing protein [Burkholderiales bacterium]|uniref:DUF2249 domain-containing protein n=1 Tax=Inhella sp. TaxID=1921806 RepID=UPI001AC10B81|nr:DUF2249 domain-containing protein [Burkholderiales bacterium]